MSPAWTIKVLWPNVARIYEFMSVFSSWTSATHYIFMASSLLWYHTSLYPGRIPGTICQLWLIARDVFTVSSCIQKVLVDFMANWHNWVIKVLVLPTVPSNWPTAALFVNPSKGCATTEGAAKNNNNNVGTFSIQTHTHDVPTHTYIVCQSRWGIPLLRLSLLWQTRWQFAAKRCKWQHRMMQDGRDRTSAGRGVRWRSPQTDDENRQVTCT